MQAGTLAWFARQEWRLTWRDWQAMIRGRRRGGIAVLLLLALTAAVLLHVFAAIMLHPNPALAEAPDKQVLVIVSGIVAISWSLMLSQAMEAVTRAFYARGDLELILTSPANAARLFAVRILAMVVVAAMTVLLLSVPFVNVLTWRGGVHWLAIYPVIMAMAMLAVTVAILLAVALFHAIGPSRTRLASQIVSAVIGAVFAIILQFAALLFIGTADRLAFLTSARVLAAMPDPGSRVWLVADAVLGEVLPLLLVIAVAAAALAVVTALMAPRFGGIVLACASIGDGAAAKPASRSAFRNTTPRQSFRRKEWILLRRDPWLLSQTLVQVLYLLPAAYMVWLAFDKGIAAETILVPLLVTAAGQFAGGVAWLAISGEDAPDLIQTAPVPQAWLLRGTFEAVTSSTLIVFVPFLLALAVLSPAGGAACLAGIVLAALSATAIQHSFRLQARRGRLRRRQTASRLTTYIEALSSIAWATAAALASTGSWLAALPIGIALLTVGMAWLVGPSRGGTAAPSRGYERPGPQRR
ncbi:MAG: hypothetical protein U1E70_25555 [Acetobacteraceae bacterium]